MKKFLWYTVAFFALAVCLLLLIFCFGEADNAFIFGLRWRWPSIDEFVEYNIFWGKFSRVFLPAFAVAMAAAVVFAAAKYFISKKIHIFDAVYRICMVLVGSAVAMVGVVHRRAVAFGVYDIYTPDTLFGDSVSVWSRVYVTDVLLAVQIGVLVSGIFFAGEVLLKILKSKQK